MRTCCLPVYVQNIKIVSAVMCRQFRQIAHIWAYHIVWIIPSIYDLIKTVIVFIMRFAVFVIYHVKIRIIILISNLQDAVIQEEKSSKQRIFYIPHVLPFCVRVLYAGQPIFRNGVFIKIDFVVDLRDLVDRVSRFYVRKLGVRMALLRVNRPV